MYSFWGARAHCLSLCLAKPYNYSFLSTLHPKVCLPRFDSAPVHRGRVFSRIKKMWLAGLCTQFLWESPHHHWATLWHQRGVLQFNSKHCLPRDSIKFHSQVPWGSLLYTSSDANHPSRLSLVLLLDLAQIGHSKHTLFRLDWFARATLRTQRNILLTRLPVYYIRR